MLLPAPTPSPAAEAERRLGAPAPLKAGEINDNEQFQAYLDYLADFHGAGVLRADVSERYIISVLGSDQQPYMDATVRVYDEQNQMLFEGRTYAGGQTIFLPGVLEVSPNVQQFRVVAEHGNASTETMLERGQQERLELSLESEQSPDELRLDVLFLLDTTGSMADELNRIQETIDSIAQRIDAFEPRPTLRFGLVAYRDQGDDYVTRDYNFTEDVGAFRDVLDTFDADGGGDTPEALEAGLHQSIHNLQWSDNGVRLIFLVADAGPQLHRHQNYTYLSDAQQAVAQGIKIYPIAASNTEPNAEYVFRQLAQQTMGSFIFLTYQAGASGGAPGEQRDDLAAGTESQYTVERLDDLIVQVVQRELAAAVGAR
jgi:Mg-chelatase subunit ChlD